MNSICYKRKNELFTGEIISADVFDENNDCVLKAGTVIDDANIVLLNSIDYIQLVPVEYIEKIYSNNANVSSNYEFAIYFKKKVYQDMQNTVLLYLDRTEINVDVILNIAYKILKKLVDDNDAIYELSIIKDYSHDLYEHSLNSAVFSILIGIMSGFNEEKLFKVSLATIYSNLGKTRIDKSLINKVDKLTEEQFEEIKKYTSYGSNIAKKIHGKDQDVPNAIYMMREKWDGTGYPNGLKGNDISLSAQVVSISTYLAALVCSTVYKEAINPYIACKMLVSEAGKSFDKKLVIKTMSILGYYDIGMIVLLKNGEVARVVKRNRFNPVVKIVSSSNIKGYEIDLETTPGIKIANICLGMCQ